MLEKIQNYVASKEAEMLALWQEIVNIDSGSEDIRGVRQVADCLSEVLEAAGIDWEIVDGSPGADSLVGRWNSQSEADPIVFIGHLDTVFPKGTVAKNPFRLSEAGVVYGPGNFDMKGGLVIAIYVVKALQEMGYRQRPIKLLFVGDEEILHRDTDADHLLEAECQGAAYALNFESGRLNQEIILSRMGAGIASFEVEGVAVHSGSQAGEGRSALLEAAYKIQAMEALNDYGRQKVVNVGTIQGGTAVNIVPDDCRVTFDFRFATNAMRDEIVADLDQIFQSVQVLETKTTWQIDTLINAMERLPQSEALFDRLNSAQQDIDGTELKAFDSGGASDAAIPATLGIPTLCGLGVVGGNAHRMDEYSYLASLYSRTILVSWLILKESLGL